MNKKDHKAFYNYADQVFDNGFSPIPVHGKIPAIRGWVDREITKKVVSDFKIQYGFCNLGIRGQGAIDVDVNNEALAKAILEFTHNLIGRRGKFCVRRGQWPRFLIPVNRVDGDDKMISSKFTDENRKPSIIEYLGEKQQFVIAGEHPKTGKPFEWDERFDSILTTKKEELPDVTTADIKKIYDHFEAVATLLDMNFSQRGTSERSYRIEGDDFKRMQEPKTPLERYNQQADVIAYLESKGWQRTGRITNYKFAKGVQTRCVHFTRPGKDDGSVSGAWMPEVYTFKCWTTNAAPLIGQGKTYSAFDLLIAYDHEGDKRSAFRWLYGSEWNHKAADDFVDVLGGDVDRQLLNNLVLDRNNGRIIDISKPILKGPHGYFGMGLQAAQTAYANLEEHTGERDYKSPLTRWKISPERVDVDGVGYHPAEGRLYKTRGGIQLCNTFDSPEWQETEDETYIEPALKHFRYLLEDESGFEYYMNWFAFTICRPWERSTIAPLLISSDHGTGRGWVDSLARKLLGSWNCTDTTIDTLAGAGSNGQYHDYLYQSLWVSIPEARGFSKNLYAIDDAIRDKITASEMQLNLKYGRNATFPIFAAIHMTSNNKMPLIVTEDDRRIWMKECLGKRKSPAYYNNLYAWLKDDKNIRQFYWWLERRCQSMDWNPYAPAPHTREKVSIIKGREDPMAEAIQEIVDDKKIPDLTTYKLMRDRVYAVMLQRAPKDDMAAVAFNEKHFKVRMSQIFSTIIGKAKYRLYGQEHPGRAWVLRNAQYWLREDIDIKSVQLEVARWADVPAVNINKKKRGRRAKK